MVVSSVLSLISFLNEVVIFLLDAICVDEVKMFEASQKQRLPGSDRHPDPLEKRMIRPALDVQALNI